MNSVPYLYVNLTALCCYCLMFITFMAAKKTPEIRAFIIMIGGFIIWTGGSILMRLQFYPGMEFWYYISLLALFSLAFLIYYFVYSFANVKGYFLKTVWAVGTLIILILTPTGIFLGPPKPTIVDGGTVYLYEMNWPIAIPLAFFLCIVFSIFKIFINLIKEKGSHTPGLRSIILGCIVMAVGNMVQIRPGNVFPWDTLSGIVFALLLMNSMYRKRMFRLTLIISRSLLLLVSAVVCVLLSSYFVTPLINTVADLLNVGDTVAVTIVMLLYSGTMAIVLIMLKRLLDRIFNREEQQGRLLNDFSKSVSKSLSTNDIMEKLVNVIKAEIPVKEVYICLAQKNGFVAKYSSRPLTPLSFSIALDNPCITYFNIHDEPYFILREFKFTPLYLSMWESEKELFRSLELGCMVALRDNDKVIGLILLTEKEKGAGFTNSELSFLTAISSIASIAVKNASLYERIYQEARTDSLTGVYNYRCFVERIEEEFEACRNSSLALLYLDLDDFKLYNHLYGAKEGDEALRMIAGIISRCVGNAGTVFRCSGKVFAVLLPGYDGRRTNILARDIQARIAGINMTPERSHLKPLTVSGGICVAPYAASSAKELMDNADLAAYRSKCNGKNKISMFKGVTPVSKRISEKAHEIVEQGSNSSIYKANSTTIFALTAAIDAKDHYTYRHSRNVALYASILATAAGLNADQIRIIYEAALLHDIGKISIPEHILTKKGRLTEEEFEIMKSHVNNSIHMIRHLPSMDYLIPAAIGHHERWDGMGYPRGIAGEEIPVAARCLAIADAFDAMTSNRSYRSPFSAEHAADEIENNAGTQFDPKLARIFVDLVRSGEIPVSP
ncbi:MAG TPA: diguanylate cyclase [Clostridiales bacterium]|nr:diguanylate cyclase [Clostridiales bacterium]